MSDVKISKFADDVGVSVEKLLAQMSEAGLPHTRPEQVISSDDKNTLLLFLRRTKGDREGSSTAPRKITLRRKNFSTLKTASAAQGRGKTVNVEVRRKRTYVKRSTLLSDPQRERDEEPADELHEEIPAATEAMAPTAGEGAAAAAGGTAGKVAKEQPAAVAASPAAEADAKTDAKDAAQDLAKDASEDGAAAVTENVRGGGPVPAKAAPPRGSAAEAARAGKAAGKRRHGPKGDGKGDGKGVGKGVGKSAEEGSAARRGKTRNRPARRGARQPVDDDFVLQGELTAEGSDIDPRLVGRKGRRRSPLRKHGFEKPVEFIAREIKLSDANPVSAIAAQMSVKVADLTRTLARLGGAVGVDQALDRDTATLLIEEMGHKAKYVSADAAEERLRAQLDAVTGRQRVTRAPVVTVMGHVDHGKTSLLDYIRKSTVADGEAGGITQHIGAYHVETAAGMVSFLDTPGHAAFSAMRSRGAKVTDVIVLVVAADDGVKPQTEEAVAHGKAAGVPLVVAVNKMDKEGADPERVKTELAALEVVPEDWGGDTQYVEVSAHTGAGIDKLLEAILLQAELLELAAFTDVPARGAVIESRLDRARGPVASVLVRNGTLRVGDVVLAGREYGKVRVLQDEHGQRVAAAGPSIPVEILGLGGVPDAGDEFLVVDDEKLAREVIDLRRTRSRDSLHDRQLLQSRGAHASFSPGRKSFNVILKADVRGSLEAISAALRKLSTDEVEVKILSAGIGGISENDANLAATSRAMLMGFNVRADKAAMGIVENERLQLRYYDVIYNIVDDAKTVMGGLLEPELRERIVGVAEVREVFNSPKYGAIAGSVVVEGTVYRSKPIRVLRDNTVIYKGELESLRRFQDDAAEVRNGLECGIGVRDYKDVQVGDKIEVYETTEVARTL